MFNYFIILSALILRNAECLDINGYIAYCPCMGKYELRKAHIKKNNLFDNSAGFSFERIYWPALS